MFNGFQNGSNDILSVQKSALSLEARGPPRNTSMPGPNPSPSQTIAGLVHALLHNYATPSQLIAMGRPKFTPKTAPLHFNDNHPSNTPILDRPHSPSQTASGSIQPFCHSTLSRQTDRQSDRQTDRPTDRHTDRQMG